MERLPPIAREVLARLLDRFERPDRDPKRVVRVRLKADVPAYQSGARHDLHAALRELERQHIITLHWVRHEENNWLDKVDLNPEQVEALYALMKRTPRRDQTESLQALIDAQTPIAEWHAGLLQWLNRQLDAHRSVAPFRLDDPAFNADLLAALAAMCSLQSPTLERTFSAQVFGDSKRLEELRPAVLTLLRRHSRHAADYGDDEAGLLRAHHLHRLPEYILLCGPVTLRMADRQFALTPFQSGIALPASTIREATVVDSTARAVITIENAASYHELIAMSTPEVLHIYTGGFASPTVISLLRAIRNRQPSLPFFHWGDLDAGGLRILAHLRKHLVEVSPLAMDSATFAGHRRSAQPLTARDRDSLAQLRRHPALADCAGLIDALLAAGQKLEQEAIEPGFILHGLQLDRQRRESDAERAS